MNIYILVTVLAVQGCRGQAPGATRRSLQLDVLSGHKIWPGDEELHEAMLGWQRRHERNLLESGSVSSRGVLIYGSDAGLGNQVLATVGALYLAYSTDRLLLVNMTRRKICKIGLCQEDLETPIAAALHSPADGVPWATLWHAFTSATPLGRETAASATGGGGGMVDAAGLFASAQGGAGGGGGGANETAEEFSQWSRAPGAPPVLRVNLNHDQCGALAALSCLDLRQALAPWPVVSIDSNQYFLPALLFNPTLRRRQGLAHPNASTASPSSVVAAASHPLVPYSGGPFLRFLFRSTTVPVLRNLRQLEVAVNNAAGVTSPPPPSPSSSLTSTAPQATTAAPLAFAATPQAAAAAPSQAAAALTAAAAAAAVASPTLNLTRGRVMFGVGNRDTTTIETAAAEEEGEVEVEKGVGATTTTVSSPRPVERRRRVQTVEQQQQGRVVDGGSRRKLVGARGGGGGGRGGGGGGGRGGGGRRIAPPGGRGGGQGIASASSSSSTTTTISLSSPPPLSQQQPAVENGHGGQNDRSSGGETAAMAAAAAAEDSQGFAKQEEEEDAVPVVGLQIRMLRHKPPVEEYARRFVPAAVQAADNISKQRTQGGNAQHSNARKAAPRAVFLLSTIETKAEGVVRKMTATTGAGGSRGPAKIVTQSEQPETRQAFDSEHIVKAATDMLALAVFTDALVTSSLSTFGYVAAGLFPKPFPVTPQHGPSPSTASSFSAFSPPAVWVAPYLASSRRGGRGKQQASLPSSRGENNIGMAGFMGADSGEPCAHWLWDATGSCNALGHNARELGKCEAAGRAAIATFAATVREEEQEVEKEERGGRGGARTSVPRPADVPSSLPLPQASSPEYADFWKGRQVC